jgi:hypothetical protein
MNAKKIAIGAAVIVIAYQAYKILSKPKGEVKSSASGDVLKYNKNKGKVFKIIGKGFESRWVMLSDDQQPKSMSWYNLNGKWIWTKWNGKLDSSEIPRNQLLA